jgi:hypothetical protein
MKDFTRRYKLKRLFLPIRGFAGFDNSGTADVTLSQGTPTLEPSGGGAEIATLPMDTADEVHTVIPIPWDLNRTGKVAGRVVFIADENVADDAPVFKLGTKFLAKQEAVPELQANADVTTTITHDGTTATDNSLEATPWFDLSWDSYITSSDILAGLALELDNLGGATTDATEVVGLQLAYEIDDTDWAAKVDPIQALIDENPA